MDRADLLTILETANRQRTNRSDATRSRSRSRANAHCRYDHRKALTIYAQTRGRLVACLMTCLMPILANTARAQDAQAPSEPQAYCVNRSADFYPYTGEPCKTGYQLGSGNCRKTDGRMVAVPREQCLAMAGTVELPVEGGRPPLPRQAPKSVK